MINKSRTSIGFLAALVLALGACDTNSTPVSTSGVHKATVHVDTQSDGRTVEQQNVADRLKADNTPGSIKHLYVISAYSGQVILYSTVRGKVTSGSKRLSPSTVGSTSGGSCMYVDVGGQSYCTSEVLGDDGAYGSSGDYIFWFDAETGGYHQHYNSGGQIVHVSSVPLVVKGVIINISPVKGDEPAEPAEVPQPKAKK